jgi:hypothetical protein
VAFSEEPEDEQDAKEIGIRRLFGSQAAPVSFDGTKPVAVGRSRAR